MPLTEHGQFGYVPRRTAVSHTLDFTKTNASRVKESNTRLSNLLGVSSTVHQQYEWHEANAQEMRLQLKAERHYRFISR